jgi:hypothetical protein
MNKRINATNPSTSLACEPRIHRSFTYRTASTLKLLAVPTTRMYYPLATFYQNNNKSQDSEILKELGSDLV